MKRDELTSFLNHLLRIDEFKDYCPNGLQVEGIDEIKKIAFSVSATKESIDRAVEKNANALVVHHGLFWHFHGTKPLIGPFAKRVRPLVLNNINLYGLHLPLDAHLEFGNAASLAKELELTVDGPFGDYKGSPTGVIATFNQKVSASELKNQLTTAINHPVIHSCPSKNQDIQTIGIITGGANSDWKLACELGLDAYITGEISEHDWHEAREAGIHMFAGGHNATESFGIQALMKKVKERFEGECFFISSGNPA